LIGKTYGNYRLAQNGAGISFRLDTNILVTQTGTLIVGEWTHIVATYEASTKTARVYQDGILQTTGTNSNLDWTTGDGNFQLGTSPGESYYFDGKISIGRAYSKTLTSAEISQNYNAQSSRFI
jgi:large repetitive protein